MGTPGETGLAQKPASATLVEEEVSVEKRKAAAAMNSKMPIKPKIAAAASATHTATHTAKGMDTKWKGKQYQLQAAVYRSVRPRAVKTGGFKEIEAARRKSAQAKNWAKDEAWAARQAAHQQTRAHSTWMQGKTQTLAFGDMVMHTDAAAAQREGSVRHGVKPDFVKPMGTLGETGLAQKPASAT